MKKHNKYPLLNTLIWIFGGIVGISIIISNGLSVSFDKDLYYSEYTKLGVWNQFNESELRFQTELLLTHLNTGERADEIHTTEFYNSREKTHIEEVRALFYKLRTFLDTSIISILILSCVIAYVCVKKTFKTTTNKKESQDAAEKKIFLNTIESIIKKTGYTTLSITILLLISSFFFSQIFYYFHVVSFETDTWLMNPTTDNMINMFPEQFFVDMLLRILLYSAISGVIFIAIGYFLEYLRRQKKRLTV